MTTKRETTHPHRVSASVALGLAVLPIWLWAQTALCQNSAPVATVTPKSLAVLSEAFVQDIRDGDLQNANFHHIQLSIALSLAAEGPNASTELVNKRRAQIAKFDEALSLPSLTPKDPSLTAPFLTDAVQFKGATDSGDWATAMDILNRLSAPLTHVLAKASHEDFQKQMRKSEEAYAAGSSVAEIEGRDFSKLLREFQDASTSDDVLQAEKLAPQLLFESNQRKQRLPNFYSCGTYQSHMALGRGAFARGDYESARQHLLSSIVTSPPCQNLKTWGPSMKLSAELLSKGYSSDVIEFLVRAKAVWTDSPKPDGWITGINAGVTPSFSPNIAYH